MRTHQQIDQINLLLDQAIAYKLSANPALFEIVQENLVRWRRRVENGDVGSKSYLNRWEDIAAKGPVACIAMALEQSERATAMRQTAPFAGILTSGERMEILRRYRR